MKTGNFLKLLFFKTNIEIMKSINLKVNIPFLLILGFVNANSQIHFQENEIYESLYNSSICKMNINGDSYDDIITYSRQEGKFLLYENTILGFDFYWKSEIPNSITDCVVGDINGDSRDDILLSNVENNLSRLFILRSNQNGLYDFDTLIIDSIRTERIKIADYDYDGDRDVIFFDNNYQTDKRVVVLRNDGLGILSQPEVILELGDAYLTDICDINQDGLLDIFAFRIFSETFSYYLNSSSGFGTEQIILNQPIIFSFCGDLDGDQDLDLFLLNIGAVGKLSYIKNLGNLNFSNEIDIENQFNASYLPIILDIDNDNDLDIVYTRSGNSGGLYFRKNDGLGSFTSPICVDTLSGYNNVISLDMDRDGFEDILGATQFDKLVWFKNLSGLGFGNPNVIRPDYGYPKTIAYSDLTGDTMPELVLGGTAGSYFFTNQNGVFYYGDSIFNNSTLPAFSDLACGDIDNDGDNDIVFAGFNPVTWFENILNASSFVPHIINSNNADLIVKLSDIDNDGDLDIVTATNGTTSSFNRTNIAYNDGFGNFIFGTTLFGLGHNLADIFLFDYNYDGLIDVFQLDKTSNVVIFINQGGTNNFLVDNSTFNFRAYDMKVGDLDSDGHADLVFSKVMTSGNVSYLFWYNGNSNGIYTLNSYLSIGQVYPKLFALEDIDKDTDLDIIASYYISNGHDGYFTIENDGNGNFSNIIMIPDIITTQNIRDLIAADINFDGDVDFLTLNQFYTPIAIENLGYQNIDTATVCVNEEYLWQNQVCTTPGYFYNSMYSIYGLDSTDVLYLQHIPLPEVSMDPFWADTFCIQSGSVLLPNAIPEGGHYSGLGVNSTDVDFAITNTGNHELYYTYLDTSTGCSNSDTLSYFVKDCILISELDDFIIQIHPNPTQNEIIVDIQEYLGNQNFTIKLYDHLGRIVLKKEFQSLPVKLDIEHLKPGAYLMNFISSDGKVTHTIIKE